MSSTITTKTTNTSAHSALKVGRKSASLPPETVEYLKSWMMSPEHVAHPYPTEQEKAQIMAETGIELKQLTNWFVNNRKRFWKPRVEAKLQKFPPAGGVGGGAASHATLPGGGLSISIHHMNPKPPGGATSFPTLPNNVSSQPGAAPFFAQPQGSGLAATHDQPRNFGPAAAVAPMNGAPRVEDDPHTISEGSGSSACNSDDDSVAASSGRVRAAFGATPAQYLDCASAAATTGQPGPPGGGGYRRHEEVDVHVLRPEGSVDGEPDALPSLRDLTIKTSVPKERILATFKCPISYTIPYDIEHDRKKVQSRRDGEVLRVKKHYLKLYLATRGIHSVSSPVGKADMPLSSISAVSPATESSATAFTTMSESLARATAGATPKPISTRTRAYTCTDLYQGSSNPSPKKRARTESRPLINGDDEWRNLCQSAKSLFCESLPGLEEAARMFGYVSK